MNTLSNDTVTQSPQLLSEHPTVFHLVHHVISESTYIVHPESRSTTLRYILYDIT